MGSENKAPWSIQSCIVARVGSAARAAGCDAAAGCEAAAFLRASARSCIRLYASSSETGSSAKLGAAKNQFPAAWRLTSAFFLAGAVLILLVPETRGQALQE